MADNRSASRQRRTNQNRAARQSLASRRAAAAEKAAREAEAEQAATSGKGATRSRAKGGARKVDEVIDDQVLDDEVDDDEEDGPRRPSRTSGQRGGNQRGAGARPERPVRRGRPSGPSPVPDHDPGLSGFFAGARQVPGSTAVMASVVVGFVAFVFFTFIFKFPQSIIVGMANKAAGLAPPVKETGAELGGPVAIVFSALPLLISIVAVAFALRPERRKVWFVCTLVTVAFVTLGAGIAALPCALLLGFGAYQTSKAERV